MDRVTNGRVWAEDTWDGWIIRDAEPSSELKIEYVPAVVADKLLAALRRAYTDLLNYSYAAGGDTMAMCEQAIRESTGG